MPACIIVSADACVPPEIALPVLPTVLPLLPHARAMDDGGMGRRVLRETDHVKVWTSISPQAREPQIAAPFRSNFTRVFNVPCCLPHTLFSWKRGGEGGSHSCLGVGWGAADFLSRGGTSGRVVSCSQGRTPPTTFPTVAARSPSEHVLPPPLRGVSRVGGGSAGPVQRHERRMPILGALDAGQCEPPSTRPPHDEALPW